MKDLRFFPPLYLLILIIFVLLLTGCKGIVPSPGATDDQTINGQIKMPVACCVPLEKVEEEQEMCKAKSDYDETEFWGIVPGAVVELKNASNCQIVDTTESDETGYYVFDDVQPGLYIITAYCPSNEKYLLKDVAEKTAGVGLNAGIPDCDSTSLALVIEYLEDCYDENYFCFNQWTRIYKLVKAIAEDVGEVNIPAIQAHEDFGVLDDFDYDDLVDQVCERLEGCCISPGTTPGPGPTPNPCAGNTVPVINSVTINGSPISEGGTVNATVGESYSIVVSATDDGIRSALVYSATMDGANYGAIINNRVTLTPSVDDVGEHSVVISVYDGCVPTTFGLTIVVEEALTYNVYYDGNGNTGGTVPTDSNEYKEGDSVTVLGQGDLVKTRYIFDGWLDDGDVYNEDDTFSMPAEDVTLVADWDQDCYSLTVNIVGDGSVAKDPYEDCYAYGTVVELDPQAADGWTFTGWSGDLTGDNDPESITMDEDKEVTATFIEDEYRLTVNISPVEAEAYGCNVDVSPIGPYYYNDIVTLTPNATPGWTFSGWTGTNSGDLVDIGGGDWTITMNEDKAVTANFTYDCYSLTVNIVGEGSVATDPDLPCYTYGVEVELDPQAAPGWTFAGWSGPDAADLSGIDPATIHMYEDKEVTATFTEDCYTLEVTIVGSGSVTIDPDETCYTYGTDVILTPDADDGWTFAGWSGADAGDLTDNLDGTWTIDMDEDKAVTATFEAINYIVSLSVDPTGAGTTTGAGTYNVGDSVTIGATAEDGYNFINWTNDDDGDAIVSTSASYNFTMPAADVNYTANFSMLIPVTSSNVDVVPGQDQIRFNVRDQFGNIINNLDTSFSQWEVEITNPGSDNTIKMVRYGGPAVGPYDFQIRVESIPTGTTLRQVKVTYLGYGYPLVVVDGINL